METEKQQFRPAESKNEKERMLRNYNNLQSDLIKLSGGKWQDWILENAKNFSETVESMPDIIDLYARDPETALKKVKEAMAQKKTYH